MTLLLMNLFIIHTIFYFLKKSILFEYMVMVIKCLLLPNPHYYSTLKPKTFNSIFTVILTPGVLNLNLNYTFVSNCKVDILLYNNMY